MELKLSKAQLAVLKPDVRLVEACPGAGKTRAIVARYSAGAKSSERAFALLSFTNVAVDEALRRCANIPQATQPPNFIGTFDRFIHRFVVTPMVVRKNGKPPRYVDTWSDLPSGFDTMVRHGQVNGSGLTLAYFHADAQGDVHYPSDPPAADRVYVNQMATAGRSPSELVGLAKKRIEQLLAAGIYDSEQSRLVARSILRDPSMKWLHDRLAARFEEVIIDEFQDCSAIEHEILHSLEALGIRVVVVADPDQAIYEFRQAAPSSYVEYRGKLQGTQIVHLDENWRSSPAICGLVSSLRSISARPVLSRRDDAESPHADVVYVAVGGPDYARGQFERLATDLGIPADERLVLAATRAAASALSGQFPGMADGKTLSSKIIRHVATLRYSPDATQRRDAIAAMESILLGTIKFTGDLKHAPRKEQLEAAGIDQAQLRVMVVQLVEASESWSSEDTATASIRLTVGELLSGVKLDRTSPNQRFKSANTADWKAWTRAAKATPISTVLAGAHIHSVKGAERDAVLLDIEDDAKGTRDHILELWGSGQTHEARRVLYVGASRARRLLVLAVAPKHHAALQQILTDAEVLVEYLVEDS
ncbi:DNA/RNA helicase [Mycobacteroides abscessus subsp. abscessus]|uniref:UvrD-helicase domain-containing protein n=1 Tax=Mycobacteroides abscessus TaxID=36809 RepID=UPI00092CA19B|nr:UvrD-helicase domain-containing protein [Mycobacteroides abscessus]MBE5461938.1 hypothetical protein [Mycobacteroides abscessus]QOF42719.1 hypothetical protein E3G69_001759 [Mycobacteroides abscessus]QOF47417.1 hypothetical protein E3G70_001757 [Mycobacteroides abscessus]SHT79906.1 DNA/RNA helicase [Mycobacteroides abscessus subsp. abscessus]SHW72397.1 DNA/RNA helicase [Mycobacteroides abscessus subsp. abscessus]